jgi:hypothetical protein
MYAHLWYHTFSKRAGLGRDNLPFPNEEARMDEPAEVGSFPGQAKQNSSV